MATRRIWDWKQAAKSNRPEMLQWLKENYNKPTSDLRYFAAIKALDHSKCKHPGQCVNGSRLRQKYKSLRENYGFFTGELA